MINQGVLSAATIPAPSLAPGRLAPFPRAAQTSEHSFETSRDRILLTLLALDLMLMAFFVVMNSAASIDEGRSAQIARGLAPAATQPAPQTLPEPRAAAGAELRAAVAKVFDSFLPQGVGIAAAADDGRVDLDMPAAFADADALPPEVIKGLAAVMNNPPAGYRAELLIRAADDPARLARMARDLTAAGIGADALSVGMPAGDRASAGTRALRFTFLLLEPGEDTRAAAAAGKGDR